jgi:hypothetical protein
MIECFMLASSSKSKQEPKYLRPGAWTPGDLENKPLALFSFVPLIGEGTVRQPLEFRI